MGTQFTEKSMKEFLIGCLDKYVADGIKKSLKANKHMNDYKATPQSIQFIQDRELEEVNAREMLIQFVDYVTPNIKLDSPTTGDVVMCLARNTPFVDHCDIDLPMLTKEAVIVDFANKVGAYCGMDLAMYTSDIAKERINYIGD
jgi:hypothetical protein